MACPCTGPPAALLASLQAAPLPHIIHPHRTKNRPFWANYGDRLWFPQSSYFGAQLHTICQWPLNGGKMTLVPHLELKGKFLSEAQFYCECHSIIVCGCFQVLKFWLEAKERFFFPVLTQRHTYWFEREVGRKTFMWRETFIRGGTSINSLSYAPWPQDEPAS